MWVQGLSSRTNSISLKLYSQVLGLIIGTAYFLHSFGMLSSVRQIFMISSAQTQCCENMSKVGALGRYHRVRIFGWQ